MIAILIAAFVIFIIIVGLAVLIAVFDWHTFFMRRYGPSDVHAKGHYKTGLVWRWQKCDRMYVDTFGMTYKYLDGNGDMHLVTVKNTEGFNYDENDGRRKFRFIPGNLFGTSDEPDSVPQQWPAELATVYMEAVHSVALSKSVKGRVRFGTGSWLLIILMVVVLVGACVFFMTRPKQAQVPPPPIQTTTTAAPIQSGNISYKFGGQ